MSSLVIAVTFCFALNCVIACTPSLTTVSGTKAPKEICSGQLIFEDNFDSLDQERWKHEITLGGGGNWEFQWYVNDRFNSYTVGGILHLKPTFTSDTFEESFLTSGRVIIPSNECTNAEWFGCDRQGTPDNIINPIRSPRMSTIDSFAYKFGTLEIRAKTSAGDWLWPAFWLLPKTEVYGKWPRSGEIDLMESRGNKNLFNGVTNVGVEQAGSTLHFGPQSNLDGWPTAHYNKNKSPGWDANFHVYKLVWTSTQLQFLIDDIVVGTVDAGNGFWERGGFASSLLSNPWADATIMAPFDQEFYVIMNLAVGGTNYFADSFVNRDNPKPWLNSSPRSAADFWEARSNWEPTWNQANSDDSHLQIDYVRIWAL